MNNCISEQPAQSEEGRNNYMLDTVFIGKTLFSDKLTSCLFSVYLSSSPCSLHLTMDRKALGYKVREKQWERKQSRCQVVHMKLVCAHLELANIVASGNQRQTKALELCDTQGN